KLKSRICLLKLLSRLLAACLSLATLIPLSFTLYKYLSTRNLVRDVTTVVGETPLDQQSELLTTMRTSWPTDPLLWPTYTYFGVAAFSTLANVLVFIYYGWNIGFANTVRTVNSVFSHAVYILNILLWSAGVVLYRLQREAVISGMNANGGNDAAARDLWSYTCSADARALQRANAFPEIDYADYCRSQGYGWYTGLAQAGSSLVLFVVYLWCLSRVRGRRVLMDRLVEMFD
ncbi:hypothetical protein LTS18_014312, partial [Coniosporium uncinatum]